MIISAVAKQIFKKMHASGGHAPAQVHVSQELLELCKEDMRNHNRRTGIPDRPELEGDSFIMIVGVRVMVDPEMKLLRFE